MAQDIIGTKNGMNFFVGPNTPATAPAPVTRYTSPPPAPTPQPAAPAPAPTAYNGNPILPSPSLGTVDENSIREQTRQRMQTQIDAINANYANLISREQVAGEDRSGQTRAINARSGLMGSDFGAAQQEKTTQLNQQQVKALQDEQTLKLQSVLTNIEDRASAEIQAKKNEALQKYQMDMGQYEKAQEAARSDLKTLAAAGVDLGKLNPAQKAALLKQSGYDESFGELVYNAMKPKPKQIDYKFEKLADGKGMFYGVDPETGELKRVDVSIDLPPDWQVQIAPDGTVIGFDKNTGEARVLSEQGQFAKPEDPLDQEYKRAQIDKIRFDIANGKGDESLSPSDAKTLGVPYGTTKAEAAKLGIIPQGQLSAEAQKLQANTTSGINALKTIKRELFGDENKDLGQAGDVRSNILLRSGIGMAREYTSATKEIKDILVRLRTGAAISESEEKYYQAQLPSLKDNEQTIRAKLKRFEDLFKNINTQAQSSGSSQDLFNEFEGGGSEGTNPKVPASATISKTLASALTTKFPPGSTGGQCGIFVRNITKQFGLNYPTLGDSLTSKMNAVKKYGTSLANAKVGSVIVTKENPTYGHVAWIIGQNAQGYVVAESNFKQSNKVSYGRVIPYNSSKIVGVINPKTA